DAGDRDEVLQWLVGKLLVHPWIDRHRRVGDSAERVTVGFGARDLLSAKPAVGAAAVLDHDLLTEPLAQLLRGDWGDLVGAAAGRERADQLDRTVRLPIGMGEPGREPEEGEHR